MKDAAKDKQALVVYDNFNFLDTIRDYAMGTKNEMRNLTASLLIQHPALPRRGLSQGMHDPTQLLDYKAFMKLPGVKSIDPLIHNQMSNYLIADAIRAAFGDAIDAIFEGKPGLLPTMPNIQRLEPERTKMFQPGVVFEDEGTIDGTILVHENLWLQKFGLSPDNKEGHFKRRLWLVFGDQKTVAHIRTVKRTLGSSIRDFDRRDWMIGPCALFHVLQALLAMMVRTHGQAGPGQHTTATIPHDAARLDRPFSVGNAKYYQLEPLIAMGFNARVLAIWYLCLRDMGVLRTDQGSESTSVKLSSDMMAQIIKEMTPEQLLQSIDLVRQIAFTFPGWDGNRGKNTPEFTSHCRYIQEAALFLTLRRAIRVGDVGIIERLFAPLAVRFIGSGQYNYGQEMLQLQWLMDKHVCQEPLRRAIMAASLVNLTGRRDGFKSIDLALEHVNSMYKLDMKHRKNSTHVFSTFHEVALSSSYATRLRVGLEHAFGVGVNAAHTTRSTHADLISLATYFLDKRALCSTSDYGSGQPFESSNISREGSNKLFGAIDTFNRRVVRHPLDRATSEQPRDVLDYDTLPP